MSFIGELKRRNVFRVGAAYLVVAWLITQVVDTLGDLFGLSDAFGRGIVILLAIGFPIALVVSWIYEVTPQGITTQAAVDAGAQTTSGKKLNAVIIGGLVLVIVMLLVKDVLVGDEPSAPAVSQQQASTSEAVVAGINDEIVETGFNEQNSIAVLPFTNLSNDPYQEYFSDGLTEELIAKLSSVEGLLVTGRTSVFYFKGSTDSPQQIADSLGVNHILQGSVRKAGNQLRITTTLMDTENGFNLWTETYNRELADIFAIQDEIAEEVTQALSFTLGAGEFDRPGMTRNIQAYDAWLQFLSIPFSSDTEILQARVDALERAVALDPEFALAWWQLSTVTRPEMRDSTSPAERQDILARMTDARRTAERLAPDMRELQLSVSAAEFGPEDLVDRDQALAELVAQFGNLETDINVQYANFLGLMGRTEEGLYYARRAYRLDPFNDSVLGNMIVLLQQGRLYNEARELLEKQLMLQDYVPGVTGFAEMAMLEMLEGNWAAAKAATNNSVASREGQLRLLDYMERNDMAGGLAEIRRMLDDPTTNVVLRMRHLNSLAALMGDPQLALETMPAGMSFGSQLFSNRQFWRAFGDEVRKTPEFKQRVEELGLVNYWRTTGNWGDYCRPLGSDDFECF